jgi:hypothetical protein
MIAGLPFSSTVSISRWTFCFAMSVSEGGVELLVGESYAWRGRGGHDDCGAERGEEESELHFEDEGVGLLKVGFVGCR